VSAPAWPDPPVGFVLWPEERHALYAAAALANEVRARGLGHWTGWERALAHGSAGSGRGVSAVIDGGSGTRWRLKAMRRGGLLAAVWRDRYPSARRLVATLSASVAARERGVPTAVAVALFVESGAAGLARGAMAFEEIEGSEDLARRVVSKAATREDIVATVTAVRAMHDLGVDHPDLNLGNVLLRKRPDGSPEALLIDFDRATFSAGPLSFGARQAGLRRLERSCAKLTGAPGPLGPGSEDVWYTAYAGEDAKLAHRLADGRPVGRFALAVHRARWRKNAS